MRKLIAPKRSHLTFIMGVQRTTITVYSLYICLSFYSMLVIFSLIMAVAYALFDQTRPTACPAAGFVTYENRRVLRDNQFFTFAKVDGIDDCYRQCISHLECGFFEIPLAGVCLMYRTNSSQTRLAILAPPLRQTCTCHVV